MKTITDVKRRAASTTRWLNVLCCGLNGNPQRLGSGEGDAFEKCMTRVGFQVITRTRAERRGLRLKKRAKPIAKRYYDAPISDYGDLYLIQQFTKV